MSDIVRDLDLRTILGSLLVSGRHEHHKVDEVIDLTVRYAEELDRRRIEPRRPPDGRPPLRRK
jgi:hypothetical protein